MHKNNYQNSIIKFDQNYILKYDQNYIPSALSGGIEKCGGTRLTAEKKIK